MSDSRETTNQAGESASAQPLTDRIAELEHEKAALQEALAALRESEERHRTLLENAPIGVYRTTPDGRILHANAALVKMLGYPSLNELAKRRLEGEYFEPDYPRSEFRKRVEQEGTVIGLEAAWKRRDGSVILIRENAKAVRTTDGTVVYYEGTVEDITERKRTNEERTARRNRTRGQQAALVRLATNEAVVGGDFEQAVKTISKIVAEILDVERVGVWLFEAQQKQLRCVSLYRKSSDDYGDGVVLDMDRCPRYFEAVTTGRAIDASDAQTDPRTSEFTESYLAPLGITSMLDAPIRLAGEVIGIICHEHVGTARTWLTDEIAFAGEAADQITQALMNGERRQAEEELARHRDHLEDLVRQRTAELEASQEHLRRSERLASIASLAAGIAHEISNPLSAILMDAKLALEFLEQPNVSGPPLRHACEETARCIRAVKNFLRFAEEETDKTWPTDLNSIILRAQNAVQVDAEKAGVSITLDLMQELPKLDLNPAGIEQAFICLIRNAIQACSAKGQIAIRTYQDAGMIRAVVSDDGCGMAPEEARRAFDPFFSTRPETRAGLGLSMVEGIVARHGGNVDIQSALGEGTTVTVAFPPAAASDERSQAKDERTDP